MICLPSDVYKIIYKMLYDNVKQDIIKVVTLKDDNYFDILRANGGLWVRYYVGFNICYGNNMLLWEDVGFDFDGIHSRLSVIDGVVYLITNNYGSKKYTRMKASFKEISTWKYIQRKLKDCMYCQE